MPSLNVLIVANKRLPDTDYRVVYGWTTTVGRVFFALPEKPANLHHADFIALDFREGLSWSDARNFLRLYKVLRRGNFDLVHFFSTKLILVGPILARIAGVPALITVTGLGRVFDENRLLYRILRTVYWSIMRISVACARRVYFQNHGHLHMFAARLPHHREKLRYIGSAVALSPVSREQTRHNRSIKVLLVARLIESKGIDDFLAVAEQLHNKGFDFILVGPASRGYEALFQRVKDADARGIIEYAGELVAEELVERFRQADVFYFPSRGEGLPRVMLEAAMAGLYPIAYDIPANQDLVADGRGKLLPIGDVSGVVRHLQYLRENPSELARAASAYQEYVINTFSIEAYVERMDEEIRNVISSGSREHDV